MFVKIKRLDGTGQIIYECNKASIHEGAYAHQPACASDYTIVMTLVGTSHDTDNNVIEDIKLNENDVYFMNSDGKTIDKYFWMGPSKPTEISK